jgi:hypothetical protein
MRMGGNLRYSRFLNETDTSSGGLFNFTARATNEGLATFLLGWTSTAQFLDGAPVIGRTDYWALFFADDWKVTPKLTLNLGLRWDMDSPLWRKDNLLLGKYASRYDRNNFGPRVGFAWRPAGDVVLRGGYGVFYNGPFLNIAGISTIGFNQQSDFTSPDGGFTPTFLLRDGVPALPAEQQRGPGFGAVPVGQPPRISPDFIQRDHVNGYHHQFSLSVQKQILGSVLVEAGYMGNLGQRREYQHDSSREWPRAGGAGPKITSFPAIQQCHAGRHSVG